MEQKFIVVTDDNFSEPMTKEEAIKSVKEYEKQGVIGYIVSEAEANRIETPQYFNKPNWS